MRKTHALGECSRPSVSRMRKLRSGPVSITEAWFPRPFIPCLGWYKTEPPTASRPESVRLLSCQLRLAVQCGKVLATGGVKWYL